MADFQMFLEAERRGILPADKIGLLQEARNRGLIPPLDQPSTAMPTPRQTGTIVDQIPGYGGPVPAATAPVRTKDYTIGQKLAGAAEVIPALVTGAVTAPIVEASKIYGAATSGKFGTQAGIRAGEETGRKMQANFYQPRTQAGQEYVGDIGNALASTGLQGVPMNVLADLGAGLPAAGRAAKDFGQAKMAQRAESIAQQQSAADWARAPAIEAAQAAQRLNVAVNPAKTNPNVKTKMLVGLTGESEVNAKLAESNAPKWNDWARKDLGLPENTQLTPEAFDKARAAHTAPYDAIRKIGVMQPSDDVLGQLNSLKLDPRSTSSPEKAAKVNAAVDRVMNQTAEGLSGENVVSQIRDFRKDANQTFKNPNATGIEIDVAEANLGIANALENLIENNIRNPKALDDFRKARTAIAKTYDWERATGVTTKQVDPLQIVKLAEKGKPLTGVLADVANVAGNFPEIANLNLPKEPLLYQRLRRGGAGGTIGFALGGGPVGAAIGAGLTSLGGEVAANVLAKPGVQNRLAVPADRRIPLATTPVEPMAPIPQNRALTPYDYSQQTFTPPNFVMQPNQYGPQITPVAPQTANMLGYGGTMETLAAERARAANMSRTLGQQAEAQQAAAEAAARRPSRGGTAFELDPATGKLVPIDTTLQRATPDIQIIEDTGKTLASAVAKMSGQMVPETIGTVYKTQTISPKTGAQPYTRITKRKGETTFGREGQAFNMTAEEKIAWNKAKVDLAEVVPGMKALDDKAIANKMMDREWLQEAIVKAKQKAQMQAEIAARATSEKTRRLAEIEREKLKGALETLEEQFRKSRPVQRGGQGPKTRAFQRNMLRLDGEEIQNALRIDLSSMANK